DVGPTGRLLKPYGDLGFEDAVDIFAKTVRLAAKYGAEIIFIQTMSDTYETKAAVIAAKENCDLPVIVCNAYGENGKLLTGATPSAASCMLEGLGVDALGVNCSFGPKELSGVVDELLACTSLPVAVMPNAGIPKLIDGKTRYDVSPEDFAKSLSSFVDKGVRLVGGCCGTSPDYIRLLANAVKDKPVIPLTPKRLTRISSYSHEVRISEKPVIIGERINPTGKKRFKAALKENDTAYVLKEGVAQQESGADVLDVNVGIPEIDEKTLLPSVVEKLQAVVDLPLQIDTSDPAAMEKAVRIYNGKPLVNSVNGKKESMERVFPVVKKYGGTVIALTFDENGIPETAQGRLDVALKILEGAEKYGVKKEDIVFDPLCMTVSADSSAAAVTLAALKLISEKTDCKTSLGISNVSFGLPERDALNAAFLALALGAGLNAAIVNPFSEKVMRTFYSFNALTGKDVSFKDYLSYFDKATKTEETTSVQSEKKADLKTAIEKGLCDNAADSCAELLKTKAPLDIINEEIIPALDEVGKAYEKKTVYLPQLLMSAEAAKTAFDKIKEHASTRDKKLKCDFVLATVRGDIHDIGKNIVRLLLENYGFNVIDLGKDVPPTRIAEEVVKRHAPLCGLSALMTTTVPAMEETVALIKRLAPWCKTVVGGAVLTEELARKMGADKYAKDAMETVRFADS
ncbi:MAG: dihydropteroate synthase, partial [Clostridia bacterium]|nr:dihydropteroate synthase [Clostridia bacterium]